MSVLRTIAATIATKGFGFGVTLLSGIILARTLGPEGKGAIEAVLAWAALLLLIYPSLEEPQLYLLGRHRESSGRFVANGIALALVFGGIVFLGLKFLDEFHPDLFRFRDRKTGEWNQLNMGLLYWMAMISPIVLLQRLLGGVLQGLRDMRSFNLSFLIQNSTLLLGVVFGLVTSMLSVPYVIGCHMVAHSCAALFVLVRCFERGEVRESGIRLDISLMRELLWGGVRLHGGVVAAFVILESDKLVILREWGPGLLAIYGIAVALTGHIRRLFLQPIKEVLGSRLPSLVGDRERTMKVLQDSCRHTILLTAIPSLGLIVLGLPVIYVLYGVEFLDAYQPLLVLIPASLFWTAAVVLGYWFIGHNRFVQLTLIGVFIASMNLALNLLVVPHYGPVGAAATSLLSYATHLAIFLWVICSRENVSATKFLLPQKGDLTIYRETWSKLKGKLSRAG